MSYLHNLPHIHPHSTSLKPANYSTSAILALLFYASGHLHLLFSLPGLFFPHILMLCFLIFFSSLLKCYLIEEPLPGH